MSAVLDYGLKDAPPELWGKDRWTLLTFLMLHTNARNRCWPSMQRIAKRLGKSSRSVCSAKTWLLEHKAISLVPCKLRVDEEKALPSKQHVYQLTGVVQIEGRNFPYMYVAPENGDTGNSPESPTPQITKGKITTVVITNVENQSISKNTSRPSNTTGISKSLNRDFAKSLQNLPPIHVVPKRPTPPLLKVDPPASKAKAQPAKKTSANKKAAAKVQAAPKVRAPRKPQPTDPLWNAIADSFFNGARRDNQQLARILFGQQNHGIFGLIANEAERQNLQPQELDYDHLARLIPKFQASLPKDKVTGKPIELRDPATWLTRWEGWRNDYTDCIGTSMLTYDPNCPNHCDHGDLYTFDEKGRSTFRGYCQCRVQILEARKKGRSHA